MPGLTALRHGIVRRMRLVLALAITLLGGCFTMRAGAGLAADTTGAVAPQLTVAFGITSRTGGTAAVGRIGMTDETTRTQAVAWQHHVMRPRVDADSLPDTMLRIDGRLGMHEIWKDGSDRAFMFGAGIAYLWVVRGRNSCLYPGIGGQTRHAVGVEASLEGLTGGDPALGRGLFTIGAVYQIDWYLRASDCGS